MKYEVKPTNLFKKEYKIAMKRGYNMDLIDEVIALLAAGKRSLRNIKTTI
jgi:mRNA interferase YafQ